MACEKMKDLKRQEDIRKGLEAKKTLLQQMKEREANLKEDLGKVDNLVVHAGVKKLPKQHRLFQRGLAVLTTVALIFTLMSCSDTARTESLSELRTQKNSTDKLTHETDLLNFLYDNYTSFGNEFTSNNTRYRWVYVVNTVMLEEEFGLFNVDACEEVIPVGKYYDISKEFEIRGQPYRWVYEVKEPLISHYIGLIDCTTFEEVIPIGKYTKIKDEFEINGSYFRWVYNGGKAGLIDTTDGCVEILSPIYDSISINRETGICTVTKGGKKEAIRMEFKGEESSLQQTNQLAMKKF